MSDQTEFSAESRHEEIIDTLLDLQARLRGDTSMVEQLAASRSNGRIRMEPGVDGASPATSPERVSVVYGDLQISHASDPEPLAAERVPASPPGTGSGAPSDTIVSVTSSDLTAIVDRVEAVLERLDRLEASLQQVMVRGAAAAVAASTGHSDVPDDVVVAEKLRRLATERLAANSGED
jgi:hypothetical protein